MMSLKIRPALVVMLAASLALSACSQGGFGGFGPGNDAGGSIGAGDGSASDPTSPAFFNQVVGDRVLFAVDESTLSTEGQAVLRGQAEWLTANPEFTALIEGHADEQGTREYNLGLGARRAAAVQEYLVSLGVPDGRLRTISYGKERPLEICSSEACYSQNRRAVTVLSAGAGL